MVLSEGRDWQLIFFYCFVDHFSLLVLWFLKLLMVVSPLNLGLESAGNVNGQNIVGFCES